MSITMEIMYSRTKQSNNRLDLIVLSRTQTYLAHPFFHYIGIFWLSVFLNIYKAFLFSLWIISGILFLSIIKHSKIVFKVLSIFYLIERIVSDLYNAINNAFFSLQISIHFGLIYYFTLFNDYHKAVFVSCQIRTWPSFYENKTFCIILLK